MPVQRYSVNQYPIETLLTWIKSDEIAIPEIQRPFIWNAAKVRDFIDSLYRGYPVGYLIAWRNPDVRLKDGTQSAGKRILIDGQHSGHLLRKSIDYFCHLAVAPEAYDDLAKDDSFSSTVYFRAMEWLKNGKDDLYDPSYTDMLRVAFTSKVQTRAPRRPCGSALGT